MVLLLLTKIGRQARVVQGVMRAVIKNIKSEGPRDQSIGNGSREEGVAKLCERIRENAEQDRGHDESQAIHRKIMMDPMEEEMQHKEERSVGEESIDVKEESMKGILQDSPY